jgi:N-acetylglucosamine malate deacetylase 1
MSVASSVKALLRRTGLHPRRWLTGFVSYPRYLGYVQPQLLTNSEDEYRVRRRLMARGWTSKQLSVPVGRRLLVLAPHPDDESIGPGGLLLAHRDCADIHLILISDGANGGVLEGESGSLVEVRKAELNRVAADLGIKSLHCLDYPDGQVPRTAEAAERLSRLVRQLQPDVVLLPWFLDDHADHRATNWLFAHGCADLDLTVLGYEIASLLEPNAIFDITVLLDAKQSLIRHHASQLRMTDYLNYSAGLARVRAHQYPLNDACTGAVEAYLALPNREYCELVLSLADQNGSSPP